jgi:hypothetical protein
MKYHVKEWRDVVGLNSVFKEQTRHQREKLLLKCCGRYRLLVLIFPRRGSLSNIR